MTCLNLGGRQLDRKTLGCYINKQIEQKPAYTSSSTSGLWKSIFSPLHLIPFHSHVRNQSINLPTDLPLATVESENSTAHDINISRVQSGCPSVGAAGAQLLPKGEAQKSLPIWSAGFSICETFHVSAEALHSLSLQPKFPTTQQQQACWEKSAHSIQQPETSTTSCSKEITWVLIYQDGRKKKDCDQ